MVDTDVHLSRESKRWRLPQPNEKQVVLDASKQVYEGWNFNSGNYSIYLQLIQNRYMFRSFTVLQCSHQHCVQPVASDVEVVGYL